MEKKVDSIVFRRLTKNDFDKINKPGSAYKSGQKPGGGGQSYIDFPIKKISLAQWREFLGDETSEGAQDRPKWDIIIHSLGINNSQSIRISNRRDASVCITSQKIDSTAGNRVLSWHPKNAFPLDYDPDVNNLVIYIVKTTDGEYWAGWFLQKEVPKSWEINDFIKPLFDEESAGYLKLTSKILIDIENKEWPFYVAPKTIRNQIKTEDDIEDDQLNQDISHKLEMIINGTNPEIKERLLKIRQRNNKIVKNLKKLYKGHCQISGYNSSFKKKDGEWYSEVHHLIALGENGSDAYENAIVVSPFVHRMLHYANVSEIDLTKIRDNKLKIKINDKEYEITWHPEHFKTVADSLKD